MLKNIHIFSKKDEKHTILAGQGKVRAPSCPPLRTPMWLTKLSTILTIERHKGFDLTPFYKSRGLKLALDTTLLCVYLQQARLGHLTSLNINALSCSF